MRGIKAPIVIHYGCEFNSDKGNYKQIENKSNLGYVICFNSDISCLFVWIHVL